MRPENTTRIQFDSLSANEGFARGAVAAFLARYDPTVPQLADIKTAVSEAVTNCIVHGYRGTEGWIELTCRTEDGVLHIEIADSGRGIADIGRALTPFYTSLPEEERSGMGFTIMQTFMSDFSVASEAGKGTMVRMSKKMGARAAEDAR